VLVQLALWQMLYGLRSTSINENWGFISKSGSAGRQWVKFNDKKKISVSQIPRALKDEMLDVFKFEDNIARTSAMALSKLSRQAELLKLELETQNTLEIEANASSI
jgi:K+/H+ antiporter YhaU regulatory subunit KhtT